ncbi:hypothetical protein EV126DRAFT_494632 [Verticillium dahliae]|nr:hypothetical protein EV126DRAFT_489680 [Verticillium dahliae]KAH6702201.1 hypothetical protein EV126DRAFT_494632 [Verticillium dahliae]
MNLDVKAGNNSGASSYSMDTRRVNQCSWPPRPPPAGQGPRCYARTAAPPSAPSPPTSGARGVPEPCALREAQRRNMVVKAATDLVVEFPKTEFVARTSDIANFDDTAALWADLAVTGVSVDVLVLNAASMGPSEPIISADNLVYLASAVTHMPGMDVAMPAYFLDQDGRPAAPANNCRRHRPSEAPVCPFDDIKLPSDCGIWAATKEAEFLHGKFVWAGWDVDELRSEESQRQFERNPRHLSIRLVGIWTRDNAATALLQGCTHTDRDTASLPM